MGDQLAARDTVAGEHSTLAISVAAFSLVLIAIYWETVWGMVSIWNRSDTYAHGYLIVPISLWLVWNKKEELVSTDAIPAPTVQLLLLPGGFVWLLAYLTDVLVIQQLAIVGMLIVGIWSLVGHAMARVLAFPLGFLFLGVPMGEDLVPPMMEFTATSTVWLIKLTGIPVYREGLYFTLPSGNWSVVEACSGVRYLIASFTLGLLYAHLTYKSLGRQLLFVLASILVPVLANSARAYIIVMLGHLSGMTIATGVDHLVYGWVFFGIVMMILFWVGSFWREDLPQEGIDGASAESLQAGSRAPTARLAFAFASALVAVGIWPLVASTMQAAVPVYSDGLGELSSTTGNWQKVQPQWQWQPLDRGAKAELIQFYQSDGDVVAVYLQQFVRSKEGAELISGKLNEFVDESSDWRIVSSEKKPLQLNNQPVTVRELIITDNKSKLRLWFWYRIGNRYTANPYTAKLLEVMDTLSFGRSDSVQIILAANSGPLQSADSRLPEFKDQILPQIESVLDKAAELDE
jgi:exosortase A